MSKQIITGTLIQGAFFSVNKAVAKYLKSNDAALILSHLIYLQEHHFGGNEFYQQQERLMEECNVSLSVLRSSMKILSEGGMVSIKRKGTPAKNYYYINYSRIAEILDSSSSTNLENKISTPTISQQISENGTTSPPNTILPVSQIRRSSGIDSVAQRVYNKDNITEINYKINKLKEVGRYSDASKVPSSFTSRDSYIEYLYDELVVK